ncbi:uncharacterized protein LAESUDRAFT_648547 [Laetiporus sulphureus 93-53]|uniref:RING-type domain-containing protein n=1 Tax=Laetiporus sulphureus 93-53 TaxID=1314785 RepID=A0A165F799_9APHY|nr:uncharacterized protein LAESUDRAFT_648547 [Laetiporus sulphureus 93-53]KZT08523.1 hypothetical protein LAESUDRAFT_648547 [Laetiporus sulphureus 93-53]
MSIQSVTGTPQPAKRSSKMASAQSLNHLLNFTLPPRQSHQSLPRRGRRSSVHPAVWNKERFVNAQYRFVMNPSGDYTVHFADPDIFFQWDDILQVIVPRVSAIASAAGSEEQLLQDEGVMTCPICLSPPTAPRMTKCGHVFCFPCILHYLNTMDNNKWARCPICFDSVNERQLKSVKWFDVVPLPDDAEEVPAEASSSSASLDDGLVATPHAGSALQMRLIQRPQITTLALPRSKTWPSDLLPPHQAPFHFLPDVFAYSKFMLATPAYLITDLTRDLDDLATERRVLASMGDDLSVSFVDAADAKLREQLAKAAALETPQLQEAVDNALHAQRQISDRSILHTRRRNEEQSRLIPAEEIPQDFLATRSGSHTPSFIPQPSPAPTPPSPCTPSSTSQRNPRQRRNLNPPPPSTSTYYYYQAATGMPIFLHPLDIRILFSHFNSYAAFPDTITVRVESYAESTVNDDLRKRCKYLAHFPEGADVVFVEADLEGVVGREGLKNFEGLLKMRRARRKEKNRKDDRARARAEEHEREKFTQVWSQMGHTVPSPLLVQRPSSPADIDEPSESLAEHQPQQQLAGAWGARSFASAAQAAQGHPMTQRPPLRREREIEREEDEWDVDAAFHELEQRGNRTGGKKRNARMMVLGSGGGRRR